MGDVLLIHQGKMIIWKKLPPLSLSRLPCLCKEDLVVQLNTKVTEVENSTYSMFSGVAVSFPRSENPCSHNLQISILTNST